MIMHQTEVNDTLGHRS